MQGILLGAVALGMMWAVMTIGVYIAYRILDIADLTAEGAIVLGAATAATLIFHGASPLFATAMALVAGMCAGVVTSFFHLVMKIPALLSGILSMILLYSVNIRVMNKRANVSLLRKTTIFSYFEIAELTKISTDLPNIMGGLLITAVVILLITVFLKTEWGYALRSTGNNPRMAKAQGINTNLAIFVGLVVSNGLIGLSGGLIAQYLGFADVQMGSGAIVIGLASLIIGEVLFMGRGGLVRTLIAMVLGAVGYRMIIALVFEMGMPASDLKMFTALTVAAALFIPQAKLLPAKLKGYTGGGRHA